jgi:hypothetical protein
LREHQEEFEKRGAKLAAVGLGDFNFAKSFIQDTGITFPLLIDDERKAYAALELKQANIFHMLRSDNARRRKEAKAAGFAQKGVGKNPFQLGGSFVFGPGNVDRFVHISQTFSDNAPISALLTACRSATPDSGL